MGRKASKLLCQYLTIIIFDKASFQENHFKQAQRLHLKYTALITRDQRFCVVYDIALGIRLRIIKLRKIYMMRRRDGTRKCLFINKRHETRDMQADFECSPV